MHLFSTPHSNITTIHTSLSTLSDHTRSPLISIVIPSYNRVKLLQEAVASVIAQTYTNWELIIVDDGSTDGTKEKIQSLSEQRVQVLSLSHCGNIALLRNAGVRSGSGEWVAFLDSDDIWLPEKLELQLQSLQQFEKLWSYGESEMIDESAQNLPFKTGKHIPLSGWITKELLTNKVSVAIGSLMVQRKLFEELGGFDTNPDLLFREDYELALRLSIKAEAIAVSNLLVRVREHQGRSTNALVDGNKLTAFVYGHFAKTCSDKKLKKIAKRRQLHHMTEMAANSMVRKQYWRSFLQFSRATLGGDKLSHVFSAFRRGISAQKNKVR